MVNCGARGQENGYQGGEKSRGWNVRVESVGHQQVFDMLGQSIPQPAGKLDEIQEGSLLMSHKSAITSVKEQFIKIKAS